MKKKKVSKAPSARGQESEEEQAFNPERPSNNINRNSPPVSHFNDRTSYGPQLVSLPPISDPRYLSHFEQQATSGYHQPTQSMTPSYQPTQSMTPSYQPTQSMTPSFQPTQSMTPSFQPTQSMTPSYHHSSNQTVGTITINITLPETVPSSSLVKDLKKKFYSTKVAENIVVDTKTRKKRDSLEPLFDGENLTIVPGKFLCCSV